MRQSISRLLTRKLQFSSRFISKLCRYSGKKLFWFLMMTFYIFECKTLKLDTHTHTHTQTLTHSHAHTHFGTFCIFYLEVLIGTITWHFHVQIKIKQNLYWIFFSNSFFINRPKDTKMPYCPVVSTILYLMLFVSFSYRGVKECKESNSPTHTMWIFHLH